MAAETGPLNIEKYMIVWDVNLRITSSIHNIILQTPNFYINALKTDRNEIYIKIDVDHTEFNRLTIGSNFSCHKEFKGCNTYMINPSSGEVLDVFKGFEEFQFKYNIWSEKFRFVFELKMESITSDVPPTIWKHCSTELLPTINSNYIMLDIDSEIAQKHTVLNNQGFECVVNCATDKYEYDHRVYTYPVKRTRTWSLLTIILQKPKKNVKKWHYFQTNSRYRGRNYKNHFPYTIVEIKELSTSLADMTQLEIADLKRYFTPLTDKRKMSSLPILFEYFADNKLCDITIQVRAKQIRAHKVVLAAGSTVWRNLFFEDESMATIHITDFDHRTIKTIIKFMYTGTIDQTKNTAEQLLLAATKYGITDLKKRCEHQLIKTIEMTTIVNLWKLADQCNSSALYAEVESFIRENYAVFKEMDETKAVFLAYPEMGFKLFARIME